MAFHAEKIKQPKPWIPVSWPHDGAKRSPSASGKETQSLRDKLKGLGVNMLHKSARYLNDKGGGQPTWPIIEEIMERERTGRFKVFTSCHEYLEERRNYHTKDNKIVDKRDDALKATFYAVMMRRKAKTAMSQRKSNPRPTTSCMSTRV